MLMQRILAPDRALFAHRFAHLNLALGGEILFAVVRARPDDPLIDAYVALNEAELARPGGQSLFGFDGADLVDRAATVALALSPPQLDGMLVGGLHLHVHSGETWLRGAVVAEVVRGRRIGRALGAVALAAARRRGSITGSVHAAVIERDGAANPASVAAFGAIGFRLLETRGLTPLIGTRRDRHLVAATRTDDGSPAIAWRRMCLPAESVGSAVRTLESWGR